MPIFFHNLFEIRKKMKLISKKEIILHFSNGFDYILGKFANIRKLKNKKLVVLILTTTGVLFLIMI